MSLPVELDGKMISYGYTEGLMIIFRTEKALDLTITERMIMISLCSFSDAKGQCFPSHKTIANFSGASVTTVKRNLKTLSAKGYVTVEQRVSEHGDLSTNLYTLNIQKTVKANPGKIQNIRIKTTKEKLFVNG